MMKKILLLVAVLVVAGCVSQSINQVIINARTGQKIVLVELADTPQKWQTGLMNRQSLPQDSGMLFVFPDSQPRDFWMKNTLIPLDMVFISDKFEVVDITTMQPCTKDPCPSYTSKAPAEYVLEVNANYTRQNNITTGDKVAFYFAIGNTSAVNGR